MSDDGVRSSSPEVPPPFVELDEAAAAALEAENGLRQYDRLEEMIDEGARRESFRLRPHQIQELNRLAVVGLVKFPGVYRQGGISIEHSQHQPPEPEAVSRLVDEMCDYVNDNWSSSTPIHLASYIMWRLNWIHPFSDGNGRTSRAVSYLVLCVNMRLRLPGSPTIPERIAAGRAPYYEALDAADDAWRANEVDVSVMEELLQNYLAAQLLSVIHKASGRSSLHGN